jgi:hypothetical protein
MDSKTALAVAAIGALGVLGAAWITSRSHAPEPAGESIPVATVTPSAAPEHESVQVTLPLAITGVKIGEASDEFEFATPKTKFSADEVIAVTVHYSAQERVADFPVRLSTRIMSGMMGWGDAEQTADISQSGDSFKTFRFVPDGRRLWSPGVHVVNVSVDGHEVYRQVLDVAYEEQSRP